MSSNDQTDAESAPRVARATPATHADLLFILFESAPLCMETGLGALLKPFSGNGLGRIGCDRECCSTPVWNFQNPAMLRGPARCSARRNSGDGPL